MSYCVNCGVELEKSEKACPLCGIEVKNPVQPYVPGIPRPYPTRLDPVNQIINRRFIAMVLSVILAFPAVITVAINFIYTGKFGWSSYVMASMVLIWIFCVPLFLWRKITFYKVVLPDLIALLIFMKFIEYLHPGNHWFLRLALPLVFLVALAVLIIGGFASSGKLKGYYLAAAIISALSLVVIAVEYLSENYAFRQVRLEWSFYVAIPGIAAAIICLAIARRRSWRERINRRIHL